MKNAVGDVSTLLIFKPRQTTAAVQVVASVLVRLLEECSWLLDCSSLVWSVTSSMSTNMEGRLAMPNCNIISDKPHHKLCSEVSGARPKLTKRDAMCREVPFVHLFCPRQVVTTKPVVRFFNLAYLDRCNLNGNKHVCTRTIESRF